MTYQKINFKDQNVQRPRTYQFQTNQDGTNTLIDSFGVITELGTPINAQNMNHIEDGILTLDNSIENRIINVLKIVYPIGAEYMGTMDICPLSALFGTWEKLAGDRVLQTAGSLGQPNALIPQQLPNHYHADSVPNFMAINYQVGPYAVLVANGQYSNTSNADTSNSIYSGNRVQQNAIVVNVWRRVA